MKNIIKYFFNINKLNLIEETSSQYILSSFSTKPTLERFKRLLRQILKSLAFIVLSILYFSTLAPLYLFFLINPMFTRKNLIIPVVNFFAAYFRFMTQLKVIKNDNIDIKDGSLIVGNHQSYMDYFSTITLCKGIFLSTIEVKSTPFFGKIVELAGCVFIDRRTKANLIQEINEVKSILNNNISVFIYPEGRLTNGHTVVSFKRPFFTTAKALKKDIVIVTTNYRSTSGKDLNFNYKNHVLWWRNTPFFRHFWNLFGESEIIVECHSNVLKYEDYIKEDKHLAELTHEIMVKRFNSLGPKDKDV